MAINLLRIFIFVPFHIKTVNIFQNKEECQMDKNEAIIRYAMQHGKLDDLKVWLLNGGSVNEYFTSHKQNIKLVIKELIDKENKSTPLSDQTIVKLLKGQDISISRRTVAKYRLELGIGSSAERKECL